MKWNYISCSHNAKIFYSDGIFVYYDHQMKSGKVICLQLLELHQKQYFNGLIFSYGNPVTCVCDGTSHKKFSQIC